MQTSKTAVVVAVLLGASLLAHGQALDTRRGPQLLKHEWKAGKTYVHKMEMDQTSTLSMGDQTMDQTVNMSMDMDMAVSAISGSKNKRVASEYKRIAMNMNSMGMEMNYDSADPSKATGPLAAMGELVGHKFDIIVDPAGSIVEVQGIEAMTKAMSSNPASANIAKSLSDTQQLEQMMNSWMTKGLPKKPVRPGDTWPLDVNIDMAQLGSVHLTGTFTLAGYQEYSGVDCAVIDMNASIAMSVSDTSDPANPAQALGLSVSDGRTTSRMYWDHKLNGMRGLELNQAMSLTMKNPADGSEMTIPMNQKINLTVEIR